jgi:hypothetical protein
MGALEQIEDCKKERQEKMSTEKLDPVVAGALYDFMGWLTSRKERICLSSKDEAGPAVQVLKEFFKMRGLDPKCEPMTRHWQYRCSMTGMDKVPGFIKELLEATEGMLTHGPQRLPDGSGFFTMSMPLPENHWLLKDHENEPPASLLSCLNHHCPPDAHCVRDAIRAAGRYAVRCATRNGKEMDFDPDCVVQQLVNGMLGYRSTLTCVGKESEATCGPTPAE